MGIPDHQESPASEQSSCAEGRTWPAQGSWAEADYLAFDAQGGRLVELVDGCLVLPVPPTMAHQLVVAHLLEQFGNFVKAGVWGLVLFAPCPIRIRSGRFREPDVFYLRYGRVTNWKEPPNGADLVIEVLSDNPSDRHRDLVEKRIDYAQAGIPEYWIVDPLERRITVLALDGDQYRILGEYQPGQTASSKLLEGLEIEVAAVFAAGESPDGT